MPQDEVRHDLPFRTALRFWIKLGFISFGGPAGQIAIMHRELVERRRWIGEDRFLHALNFCMMLPGPEAQQLATYIGWLLHRTAGGLAAGICFVLPSVFILLGLSYVYVAFGQAPLVAGALAGCKPVVVALVVEALLRIGKRALKRNVHYGLAFLAFVGIYFLHIPFPLIIIGAAASGLAGGRFWPAQFAVTVAKTEPGRSTALLADDTDDAPHTHPSRGRTAAILAIAAVLWLLPYCLLIWWQGSTALPAQQYRFFTVAALVTFGGAYAVLAYVTQAAVETFGWLTHAQAVDGLALAETTPGPLIMVLQFVGFVAGWNHPGELSPLGAAILGALLTTYATFLPCFVFVFLGAPYIERLRGRPALTNALSAVTAAVVGVVMNLALVFGAAVLAPNGIGAGIDWFAAGLAGLAFALLYVRHVDVLWVILGGGLLGMAIGA